MVSGVQGTFSWMSPEALRGEEITQAHDVYRYTYKNHACTCVLRLLICDTLLQISSINIYIYVRSKRLAALHRVTYAFLLLCQCWRGDLGAHHHLEAMG
jgi:hypothetical protein